MSGEPGPTKTSEAAPGPGGAGFSIKMGLEKGILFYLELIKALSFQSTWPALETSLKVTDEF